jgi:hypothetical protein
MEDERERLITGDHRAGDAVESYAHEAPNGIALKFVHSAPTRDAEAAYEPYRGANSGL